MDALSCGLSKPDIAQAVADQELSPRELKQVTIDTTVQEKNITHPTDSKLSHRAITKLAKAAKDRGIPLRQTYVRVAKQAAGHTLAQAIASTKVTLA